jgi:hypothetical protein
MGCALSQAPFAYWKKSLPGFVDASMFARRKSGCDAARASRDVGLTPISTSKVAIAATRAKRRKARGRTVTSGPFDGAQIARSARHLGVAPVRRLPGTASLYRSGITRSASETKGSSNRSTWETPSTTGWCTGWPSFRRTHSVVSEGIEAPRSVVKDPNLFPPILSGDRGGGQPVGGSSSTHGSAVVGRHVVGRTLMDAHSGSCRPVFTSGGMCSRSLAPRERSRLDLTRHNGSVRHALRGWVVVSSENVTRSLCVLRETLERAVAALERELEPVHRYFLVHNKLHNAEIFTSE